jgi:hypothetical protein
MKRTRQFFVVISNEEERAEFLGIGVDLPKGKPTPSGEVVKFEMEENDSRWEKLQILLRRRLEASAAGARREGPSAVRRQSFDGKDAAKLAWLDGYSGQTVEQLLALEGEYQVDSIVLAFEQAIEQAVVKRNERGEGQSVTPAERVVLAVEGLEREINNGGYDQFFRNRSRQFVPMIVDALLRIGCVRAAEITRKAIEELGLSALSAEAIATVIAVDDPDRDAKLKRCDDAHYKAADPIAQRLFAFIKTNKTAIRI